MPLEEWCSSLGVLDTNDRDDELWVLQQIADGVIPDTPFRVETARGRLRHLIEEFNSQFNQSLFVQP